LAVNDRIVILDGYTTNPGDLDWSPLAALGRLEAHDRTPEALVQSRAAGAAYVLLNKTPMSAASIFALPELRYIGVLATGYNTIDLGAAKASGITVTNVPSYASDSVAQHAAAMMLEFARGLTAHAAAVREGEWSRSADWCFARRPIFELTGKTLGLIGLGRIGLALARIGASMGMRLVAHDPAFPSRDQLGGLEVARLPLEAVFDEADVVSLHCPLTPQTHHLVNEERLSRMKPGALVINTSRGPLIDERALAGALRDGVIGGAALDVLEIEPPAPDNPLFLAPNCVITPHIAWYALEARARLIEIAADNLAAFQRGEPRNVVS
jgi:glycerate dehydrogenase